MRINKHKIGKRKKKLDQIRRQLEATQLKALHNLLPNKRIRKVCYKENYLFRNRLLTPVVTVFHMLNAAISREKSFQSAWHNIGEIGRSGSLAKARQRFPLTAWHQLHEWIVNQIDREFNSDFLWRGHRVIGVDGTCVSMNNEEVLTNTFGKSDSKHGLSRFPIARVVFTFMLNPLISLGHSISSFKTSENVLFTNLIKGLRKRDLIVGDCQYAGANRYIEYERAGLEFITRAHHRTKIERLQISQCLGKDDFITQLPTIAAHRCKDPTLPKSITVRVIKMKLKVRGNKTAIWLMTSLLDKQKYPVDEIKLWYKRRWKAEGLIEEIKIFLGADVLRSKKADGVYKELYARVMAFNLIHWIILKACRKHKKNPERISVSATIRLTTAYSLKMGARSSGLYKILLDKIACSTVSHRPGRSEPRMKRRDQKHYPVLKMSRAEWRNISEGIEHVTADKMSA